MPKEKMPALSGNIMLQPGSVCTPRRRFSHSFRIAHDRTHASRAPASRTKAEGNPTVDAEFKINLFGISGLKVDALQMVGEAYKPYKVCRRSCPAPKHCIWAPNAASPRVGRTHCGRACAPSPRTASTKFAARGAGCPKARRKLPVPTLGRPPAPTVRWGSVPFTSGEAAVGRDATCNVFCVQLPCAPIFSRFPTFFGFSYTTRLRSLGSRFTIVRSCLRLIFLILRLSEICEPRMPTNPSGFRPTTTAGDAGAGGRGTQGRAGGGRRGGRGGVPAG